MTFPATPVSRGLLAGRLFLYFHLFELALKTLPFDSVFRFVKRHSTRRFCRKAARTTHVIHIDEIRRLNVTIRRFDYRSRLDCLPKALAIYYVLSGYGCDVTLRFGVRTFPFAAHAWVEWDGVVVSDYKKESSAYSALLSVRTTET